MYGTGTDSAAYGNLCRNLMAIMGVCSQDKNSNVMKRISLKLIQYDLGSKVNVIYDQIPALVGQEEKWKKNGKMVSYVPLYPLRLHGNYQRLSVLVKKNVIRPGFFSGYH